MPKLGSAYIDVKADRKHLRPGLDAAHRDVNQAATGMQSSINKVNWTAVAAGAVAMAAVVGYAMRESIQAASDLEEASSKFGVVFAGQAAQAEQWAQQLVDGYAMSAREAKQYMSSIQDLLVPMGMQADAAARMSNESVRLAADLGSFNNLETTQVIDDMQSALVGNYETMKKYGVVLNATVVKEKALALGLAGTAKELTASHKAQAAYALIVDGSTAAIGDFMRTSDGYANTTKRLNAEWEDFTATIGGKFVEAATRAKAAAADLLDTLTKAIDGPSLDLKIADAQKKLDDLIAAQTETKADKTAASYERYLENEKRVQDLQTGSIELNRQSAKTWAEYNKAFTESLSGQTDQAQAAIEQAKMALGYLQDLKKLQTDASHAAKMGSLAGGGTNPLDRPDKVKEFNAALYKSLGLVVDFKAEWNSIGKQTMLGDAGEFAGIDWDNYFGGFDEASQELLEDYKDHNQALEDMSQRTADAMEDNFSDFFYNFKDGVHDIEDLWQAMTDTLARAWADMIGQMMRENLFGKNNNGGWLQSLMNMFGGNSGGGGHYDSASDFEFDGGGYLGEGVRGVGRSSGASYEFHPNEVVLPAGGATAGGVPNVQFNIKNESGVEIEQEQVHVVRPSSDSMVANIVLRRKQTSRQFRNAMRS